MSWTTTPRRDGASRCCFVIRSSSHFSRSSAVSRPAVLIPPIGRTGRSSGGSIEPSGAVAPPVPVSDAVTIGNTLLTIGKCEVEMSPIVIAFDARVRAGMSKLASTRIGRLGRSLQHLFAFLSELKAKNVDLYLHQQAVDTSTPAGRALFQMLGVFAEFERAMIVERVKAGLRRATAQGKKLGRPRVAEKPEKAVLQELEKGHGIHTVARAVGVGTGTVQRIMKRVASVSCPSRQH